MSIKIYLKEVSIHDADLLLAWRNDEETRLASHKTDLIGASEHKVWLQNTISNPNRKLYLAEFSGESIGSVRADFCIESKTWELSWTLAPGKRGQGLAKHMVCTLAESIEGAVRAEIKQGNTASIRIAEFSGLSFSHSHNDIRHYYRPALEN